MELTPKQGNFAQRYVETGNASEAYRQAYDIQSEASEWVKVEASKLLKDPNVAITVIELQKEARERHDVTMDKLTIELEEARLQAMDDPKGAAAAVSAIMAKAKLHGLLVDKTNHSRNNMLNGLKHMRSYGPVTVTRTMPTLLNKCQRLNLRHSVMR